MKTYLSPAEIIQIQEGVSLGYSLNQITTFLQKPKSSVYYQFRKIKGNTLQPLQIDESDQELVGEFIGLFAGDGSFYKTKDYKYNIRLHFCVRDESYIALLEKAVLSKLFSKLPFRLYQENRLSLSYNSKEMVMFIRRYLKWDMSAGKTYTVRLCNQIHSPAFKIGFLRGCLDSDGHIAKNRIMFATVSTALKDDICSFLLDIGIHYNYYLYPEKRQNRRDIHHITINKPNRITFFEKIKPRNIKKVGLDATSLVRHACN